MASNKVKQKRQDIGRKPPHSSDTRNEFSKEKLYLVLASAHLMGQRSRKQPAVPLRYNTCW